ncbi:hypothetical protein LguiB_022379 [Lonicera macranthoides]
MAAAVSAWGKPGAWALDSEQHEDELQQKNPTTGNHHSNGGSQIAVAAAPVSDFPSLSVAATTKTKKKKGQTFTLAEFSAKPAPEPSRLTHEDLIMLPTGPRERTEDELDRSRLGGGFRSYGDRTGRYSNGSSDEPRRQLGFNKDSNREFAPSRADEIDDWGKAKKSVNVGGFDRRERGGFFDSQSRADESDSWTSNKSFVPSEGRRFGGGFERRGGFESNGVGADSDNWGKKKEFGANGGADSDNWGKKREEGSGGARRRLNLQPRKAPVGEVQSEVGTGTGKVRGSNPFGDARPREEVLREKGQDWKEVDEKLQSMKIKEVDEKFGKRSFGSGNGRGRMSEDRFERSWRKPDSANVQPQRLVLC